MTKRYPSDHVGETNMYKLVIIGTMCFIAGWILARSVKPVSVKEYWDCRQTGNCIAETQSAGSDYLEKRGH